MGKGKAGCGKGSHTHNAPVHVGGVAALLHDLCNARHVAGNARKARHRISGIERGHVRVKHIHVDGEAARLQGGARGAAIFVNIVLGELHARSHQGVNVGRWRLVEALVSVKAHVGVPPVINWKHTVARG